MFQFYAITFGSSFFNMILGYVKFATAIGFMQNTSTRVFIAYIGIVITNTTEWIYSFIIVMNNLYIFYVVGAMFSHGPDWLEFNKFFLKHYKLNFAFATLVLPGLCVSIIHIARVCFILKTCTKRIGFWRTVCHFKNSPLVFLHSALTNLAIYEKFIAAEIEENEENIRMWTSATDVVVATTSNQKEQRSLSLPCNGIKPQQPIRFSSLPNIFDSSAAHTLWQGSASQDVAVTRSVASHRLYIAHSSDVEKDLYVLTNCPCRLYDM